MRLEQCNIRARLSLVGSDTEAAFVYLRVSFGGLYAAFCVIMEEYEQHLATLCQNTVFFPCTPSQFNLSFSISNCYILFILPGELEASGGLNDCPKMLDSTNQ